MHMKFCCACSVDGALRFFSPTSRIDAPTQFADATALIFLDDPSYQALSGAYKRRNRAPV